MNKLEILCKARSLITITGWCKEAWYSLDNHGELRGVCLATAVRLAASGQVVDGRSKKTTVDETVASLLAEKYLMAVVKKQWPEEFVHDIPAWNDQRRRTVQDVLWVLDVAIKQLSAEEPKVIPPAPEHTPAPKNMLVKIGHLLIASSAAAGGYVKSDRE